MSANPVLKELYRAAGLTVHDRGYSREPFLAHFRRLYGLQDLAWLADVISKEKATIVHAHTYGSHVLSLRAARAAGIACIRTEHSVDHYLEAGRAWYRRWALLSTDRIVAVSEDVADFVKTFEPRVAQRVLVILNGVDTTRFNAAPPLEDEPLTIAWTARLDPEKQADLAIKAVARIPAVRLNIAGDGSERKRLEALVRELGVGNRVRFLGYQNDVRPVIAASHAVINCRRREGLPLALVEAALMGRPAIAFKGSGGVSEVVEDGETGLLADRCSVDDFAALIAKANQNRAMLLRLGANARWRAESRFSLDEMCKQYGIVYEETRAARAGPARS